MTAHEQKALEIATKIAQRFASPGTDEMCAHDIALALLTAYMQGRLGTRLR